MWRAVRGISPKATKLEILVQLGWWLLQFLRGILYIDKYNIVFKTVTRGYAFYSKNTITYSSIHIIGLTIAIVG